MQNIKYLYFDLDGTILKSDKSFDPETLKYINLLIKNNYHVGIATGRHEIMAKYLVEHIQPNLPLITINGCCINFANHSTHSLGEIDLNDAKKIIEFFNSINVEYFVYCRDKIYTNNLQNWRIVQLVKGMEKAGVLDKFWKYYPMDWNEIAQEGVLKLLTINKDQEKVIADFIFSNFPNLNAESSEGGLLDIYNKQCDKYDAIKYVCDQLKVNLNDVIFFGDNHNDYNALKLLPNSVCVGNEIPKLNDAATYTTASADENGVLQFLKTFFPLNTK